MDKEEWPNLTTLMISFVNNHLRSEASGYTPNELFTGRRKGGKSVFVDLENNSLVDVGNLLKILIRGKLVAPLDEQKVIDLLKKAAEQFERVYKKVVDHQSKRRLMQRLWRNKNPPGP